MQSFAQQVFFLGSSGYTVPVVSTRKTSVFLAGERYPDEPGQGYSRSELHPGLPVAGRLPPGAGPDSLEVICDVPRSSTYFFHHPPPFFRLSQLLPLFFRPRRPQERRSRPRQDPWQGGGFHRPAASRRDRSTATSRRRSWTSRHKTVVTVDDLTLAPQDDTREKSFLAQRVCWTFHELI